MKLKPQVYIDAAMKVAAGRETFSCNAINRSYTEESYQHMIAYRKAFGFSREYDRLGRDPFISAIIDSDCDDNDLRVMLLCMMAAYCEVEE